MVTVLFFGLTLRESVGQSELQFEVTAPMTVKQFLAQNQDRLAGVLPFMNNGELLVTINRKVGSLESEIRDGDTVKLTHQSNPTYEGATWQNP